MKIKQIREIFQRRLLKYFKISMNFLKGFKVKYFIVHRYLLPLYARPLAIDFVHARTQQCFKKSIV